MHRNFTSPGNFPYSSFLNKKALVFARLIVFISFNSLAQTPLIKPHDFYDNIKPEDFVFYGGDTLKGFDLKGTFEKAKAMNCSSNELRLYMLRQERFFLFSKYRTVLKTSAGHDPLRLISRYGEEEQAGPADKAKGLTAKKPMAITGKKKDTLLHKPLGGGCNNLDFSDPAPYTNWNAAYGENDWQGGGSVFGTFANWQVNTATLNTQNTTPPPSGTPITQGKNAGLNSCSWVTICTHGTDSCGGFPMVCPGFSASCRLGGDFVNLQPGIGGGFNGCGEHGDSAYDFGTGYDTSSGTEDLVTGASVGGKKEYGAQGEEIEQSIPITSANDLLTINYAVVLNDGGHPAGQEPFVFFTVYDRFGNTIPCLQYYQEAISGSFPPGFALGNSINWIQNTVANGGGEYQTACYYKPWTSVSFDMSAYIGTTVTFQAVACGCWPGGHFAYCYLDLSCGPVQMTASPVCGSTSISALPGASSYSWSGPCISGSSTNQTVDVTCSGTYSCTINLSGTGGCDFVLDTAITVTVNPTISASATSPTICSGNSTTLNASGAGAGGTYTWAPNTALSATTGASVTASPTITTTYTVTGSTSPTACTGTKTVVVNVTPTPTVSVSAGSPTICSGNSTTLTANGATTYTWAPGIGATTSTVTVSPGSTTTYTVTGTTASCTSGAQTVSVTVNTTPTITASGTATICSGNSTTLTANGATTYTWAPGIGATTSTVSVSPGSTTTYTVTGTTGSCTSTAQTVVVTVNGTPVLTATAAPATICSGNSSTLTGGGASTYLWSTGSTNSSISVSPATSTTYTLNGNSAAGCAGAPKTVVVTVNTTPTLTATAGPATICSGNSTTLTAGGTSTYLWSTGSTNSSISVSPGTTTTYTLNGNSAAGCAGTAQTVVVTVNPTPTLSVAPLSPTICPGGNVTLTASGSSTYSWNTGATTSSINVSPVVTTTYTVNGNSAAGCPGAPATVIVNVASSLVVTVTPGSPKICSGDSITLNAGGAATYTWQPATGLSCTNCPNPIANPVSTITYTVYGASGGCKDSANVNLTVNPTPTVSIAINSISPSICPGDSIGMIASGASSYTWNPSTGLSVSTGDSVNASPAATTTYTVTGTNLSGCAATASQIITVYPVPTLTLSLASASVCAGDSIKITTGGVTTYVWSPSSGLNSSTGSSITATPTVTTTYTITGTGTGGCKTTDSIPVTVNPVPTITASAVASALCNGDSTSAYVNITSSGTSPYTYNWSNGQTTDTAGGLGSGTYTVTVTDSKGCKSDSATVTVNTNSITVTATAASSAICFGSSTLLTASGATNYTWTPSGTLTTTTYDTTTANPAVTTTYSVMGTSGGCKDSATVVVTVNTLPTITATASDTAICKGSSTVLTANGGNTYTWQPGSLTGNPVTVSPATNTTYTVTGTNASGCNSNATVSITVNTVPVTTISLSSATDTICPGQSVTLTAGSASTYLWNNGATTNSITVSPTGPAIYYVIGSNGNCSDTSAKQSVFLYPALMVSINNDSTCGGKSAALTAIVSGGKGGYNYSWSNGATGVNTITVNPLSSTSYTCIVKDGCGTTETDSALVYTYPTANAKFTPAPDTIPGGQFISFINQSTGATGYYWTFGDGNTSAVFEPLHQYPIPGNYVVTLIASDAGCSDTVSDTVYVIENIYVPNVFTPNGDGVNDVFHITAAGMKEYSIEIFNRWGERVFMADSPGIDWDGKSTSGVTESDGTYYYIILATDYAGKNYKYDGYLQLIAGSSK